MAQKLDLNTASAAALEKIPAVTRTVANRIVAERKARGGFRSVDELRGIEGVTDEIFAALKENVRVEDEGGRWADVTIDLDPNRKFKGRFGGYAIVATFDARSPLTGVEEEVVTPRALSTAPNADGVAKLRLPDLATIRGKVTFTVRAPDGEAVATAEKPTDELVRPVAVAVTPRELPVTRPAENPAFGRPTRLRGRVIDAVGRVQIAGKQVVVWGATAAEPESTDFRPLMVAETDATGYFSGLYPLDAFTAAHAIVALDPAQSVPIHLEDDGTFPGDVILVVDAPRSLLEPKEEDCGCSGAGRGATLRAPEAGDLVNGGAFSADVGQGRCVDFTLPDRTLQEFSYCYVVRTTEPSIKGLTLQDPPKIPPKLVAEIAKLAQFDLAATTLAAPTPTLMRAAALSSATPASAAPAIAELELDAGLLRKFANRPEKVSDQKLLEVAKTSKYLDIIRALDKTLVRVPERGRLTCANSVDWDDDPTIYQACTIAHGHILHFKQEWIADGYSMGRVLYSLPLAPGQKKQIAVLDWERRESAVRQESIEEQESLVATISRDRDIGEMVNSVLTESSRGGSSASTGAVGAGLGVGAILGPVGGLLGIGGGFSSADSEAWQNSSRNVSANSLQTLRDRTSQAAAAMRAQRSTVIQTVAQGERVSVTTETVANYNHCHALTIQYFEVLRHLLVRQRIVDVQECLFIPLQMTRFDRPKALRWRNTLRDAVADRTIRAGFDALERIDANYEGSDFPIGTYADQPLEYVEGDISLRFQLARPRDKDDDFEPAAWTWMGILLPSINPQEQYRSFLKDQQFKDRVFLEQYGPKIARAFVDLLKFSWIDSSNNEHALPIDTTLLSNFVNDSPLAVSLRLGDALAGIPRKDIRYIKISERTRFGPFLIDVLPQGSRVIVETGSMSYRTKHSTGYLFRNTRIANDLTAYDAVRIFTPLNAQELRNPREEDKELARRLLDHLNEHLERYHHALWWRMSPDRRYMLLDGFEAPNSSGRSVASVVDNTLIGIVGNCLVMPVSRGFHLDPTFDQSRENPIDLLEHYQPNTPIEPVRVAIPTRGVYAEAVTGACNSCEVKEEQRYWRWEESPIPDSAPAILPTSTDTRRAEPPNLTAKDLPQPIIAMQTAPAAPDPTGLGAALGLLGNPNLFRDMAGLAGTQQNAAEAFKQAMATAQSFGDKAGNLALQARMAKDIDKTMRSIDSAKQSGLITDDQAKALTQSALQSMIGGGPNTDAKPMSTSDVGKILQSASENQTDVKLQRPTGESIETNAQGAKGVAQNFGGGEPWVTLQNNTPEARTFTPKGPLATRNSGASKLQADASFAPPGAKFQWGVIRTNALQFTAPNSAVTGILAGSPGITSATINLLDSKGTSLRTDSIDIGVPQFYRVGESTTATTTHRPAIANSHLFSSVLREFQLTNERNDVVRTIRQVVEALLETLNCRAIWQIAPFNEPLPKHFDTGGFAAQLIANVNFGGYPALDFHGPLTAAGAGRTFREGTVGPSRGIQPDTMIFPGALDIASFPETARIINAIRALDTQIAANPGNATLVSQRQAIVDFWKQAFARAIGVITAHEMMHVMMGAPDALVNGHTQLPDFDLLSDASQFNFERITGVLISNAANFPAAGTFTVRSLDALPRPNDANQARLDVLFPVPPASPFS